jgi:hypothetical protein
VSTPNPDQVGVFCLDVEKPYRSDSFQSQETPGLLPGVRVASPTPVRRRYGSSSSARSWAVHTLQRRAITGAVSHQQLTFAHRPDAVTSAQQRERVASHAALLHEELQPEAGKLPT